MTVSDPDPALQGRYDEMTTPRSIARRPRMYSVDSTTSADSGHASAITNPLVLHPSHVSHAAVKNKTCAEWTTLQGRRS